MGAGGTTMQATASAPSEVVRRGQEIYAGSLRASVELPENIGKVIVIDVDTGEYEMDRSHVVASRRLRERRPEGRRFVARVGFATVTKHGHTPRGTEE
jgi:hypothetical protein